MDNPDLEARILANPDDADAYSVYGDWLSEQGDPRGELVTLQRQITDLEARGEVISTELMIREKNLIAANPQWLGELGKLPPEDFQVTWRNGFPWGARIGRTSDFYGTAKLDLGDTIALLFDLPGIAFLHELEVGAPQADEWPATWYSAISALGDGPVPAGLRRLAIDRGGYYDISMTDLGDLSRIYESCAQLHELEIEIGMIELGEAMNLPELRSFKLVTNGMSKVGLQAIRRGTLPHLEELMLCLGETGGDYGGDVELSDLEWLLAGENLANVRHLGLASSSFADELVEPLAMSKILPQLLTLDLSRGTFGREGARALLAHADKFRHLESIDLSTSWLGGDVIAQLEALGPDIIVEDNNGGAERDDRYVAISE